ncbi:hypothetical protein WH367_22895 [Comamonas sp. MYb21]|uniref:hypothetical protein n=1 Tax=Comamonas sp. MYb21 TaxID=1848648 RepID=UPI0030ABCC73
MPKTNIIAFALATALFSALVGCSDSDSSVTKTTSPQTPSTEVRFDAPGWITAVGSPVVYEYQLDDGQGVNFRAKDGQPPFKLEFRKNRERINVAWTRFYDMPEFKTVNDENNRWASNVLTYALGAESSNRIMSAEKPLSFQQGRYKVDVMPNKGNSLVTIYPIAP